MAIYCFKCDCGETAESFIPYQEISDPASHPHCARCGTAMHRDYRAEHGGLASWDKSKGIFPAVVEGLGDAPVLVESAQHHRKLMKERGVRPLDTGDPDRKHRFKERTRRFY